MTNATKSPERVEFLSDVLSTAVEGGIGYWCQIDTWKHSATNGRTEVLVTAIEGETDGSGYGITLPARITADDLARGIGVIVRGETCLADDYVDSIAAASRRNDSGETDAYEADMIFQAALFGDVIFG